MKKNFLFVLALSLVALYSQAQTTIYSQTFTGGLGSWTAVDNNSSAGAWVYTHNTISTPDFGTFSFKSPSALNGFACIVSDGNGSALNTDLKSPAIDCSGHDHVGLQFSEWMKVYSAASASVSVSTDGTNWTQVLDADYYSYGTNGEVQEIDISTIAANQSTVYLKFNYAATNDYLWAIDDIKLLDLPASDVQVVAIDGNDYTAINESYTVKSTVQNRGGTPLNSFTLTYNLGGGNVTSETFSGFNLQPFETQDVEFTAPLVVSAISSNTLQVITSAPNGGTDGFAANDTATKKVVALSHKPVKNVLLEEFTTVLCGYCPGGATNLNKLMETEGSYVVPAAIHSGFGTDVMTVNEDNTLANAFCEGAPEANIDRKLYDHTDYVGVGIPSLTYLNQYTPWKDDAIDRHSYLPPVSVSATNTYDSATRALSVTVNATFYGPASGNFRINAYVIEDSIANAASGYSQHSYYYSSPVDTSLNPWYHKGTSIGSGTYAIGGYVHNHVVRKFLGTAWGSTGIIPASTTDTTTYTKTYTYTIPTAYRAGKISIAAFVHEYNADFSSGKNTVLNVVSMPLNGSAHNEAPEAASPTGIQEVPSLLDNITLYPNPTNEKAYLKYNLSTDAKLAFEVYNVMGQMVYNVAETNLSKGAVTTVINSDKFDSGIYFVAVKENGHQTQTLKFIVSK